jgi:uncharacterized protein YjaG (DUF416 family)
MRDQRIRISDYIEARAIDLLAAACEQGLERRCACSRLALIWYKRFSNSRQQGIRVAYYGHIVDVAWELLLLGDTRVEPFNDWNTGAA